jgi:2',3'-cyclic-nucleotide 2'-phosphodiesterase (5'-nucleotidase family)
MMIFWRAVAILIILLGGAGPALADLKVIITTDVHGQVAEDPVKKRIGYARLKTRAAALARAGHTVFLLDSGDAFSGSAYAQADHGRSVAGILGLMGYRVMTPGNHAFDYNAVENNPLYYSEVLLKTVREGGGGTLDAVAENLSFEGRDISGISRAPVVIHDETGAKPDGVRLIVTGLITPYTARPSLEGYLPGYDFGLLDTPAATREKILAGLGESLKPYGRPRDVVIVLSHLGWPEGGDREGRLTGPDVAAVPNVDFVADGHTHQAVSPRRLGQAVYANGGRYLENFLEITIGVGGQGRMELKTYDDLAGLEPDKGIAEKVAEIDRNQGLSEIVLNLPDSELFSDRNLRTDNIALGRLICAAMMGATGAEMAFHNTGGIRAGLQAGAVSGRDLYDVLPFGDELVVAELSGREIFESFGQGPGQGAGQGVHGGRGWPQFYGLTVYAWQGDDGGLMAAGLGDADGRPLDLDRRYRVALNGFLARYLRQPQEKHGEMIEALRRELKPGYNFEQLRPNRSLFIFSSQEEALEAWERAGH